MVPKPCRSLYARRVHSHTEPSVCGEQPPPCLALSAIVLAAALLAMRRGDARPLGCGRVNAAQPRAEHVASRWVMRVVQAPKAPGFLDTTFRAPHALSWHLSVLLLSVRFYYTLRMNPADALHSGDAAAEMRWSKHKGTAVYSHPLRSNAARASSLISI